jgi:hypothetical protein
MPQSRKATHTYVRWFLIALLLVPVTANADSISNGDYYKNVERAVTALDTLQQTDETEDGASYENRLDRTIAGVREALPEHQSVQTSEGVYNVDNAWLHEALKQFKSASAEERPTKLAQVIERLKAVAERVEPGESPTAPANDRAKLESILARPEYATEAQGPNALSRLIIEFARWLQQFLPDRPQLKAGNSRWMTTFAQIMVVLVAAVVIFYVARILLRRFKPARRRRTAKKREPRIVLGERLEPEDTAVDLLAEAEALARGGDVRAAIRKAYIALLVELGDRKVITLAQHKTNRDYLNSVRNVPPLHQTMGGLTNSFERHWYGFIEANENDWQSFRTGYRTALQTQV